MIPTNLCYNLLMKKDPRSQNEDHTHLKSSLNTTHVTRNTKSNLPPELLFLITCAQTNPTEEDKTFLIQTIQHSTFNIAPSGNALGVQHLTAHASRHGILPLVYKTLRHLDTGSKSGMTDSGSPLNKSSQSDESTQYTNNQ